MAVETELQLQGKRARCLLVIFVQRLQVSQKSLHQYFALWERFPTICPVLYDLSKACKFPANIVTETNAGHSKRIQPQ